MGVAKHKCTYIDVKTKQMQVQRNDKAFSFACTCACAIDNIIVPILKSILFLLT